MTSEFNSIIKNGIPDFTALRQLSNVGGIPSTRSSAFSDLVTDDAKYDLKSLITTDGTPSYSAIVIGEWSIYRGTLRRYDDYGNIVYGIFGIAAGFPEKQLFQGSNINQIGKDLFGNTNGSGDEPRDVEMIQTGIVNAHFWLKK